MRTGRVLTGILASVLVLGTVYVFYRRISQSSFKRRVISNAIKEWELWGEQVSKGGDIVAVGQRECDAVYSDRVAEYWKKGANRDRHGCERDKAWSSAFISFIMKKSGAGDDFKYSSAHNRYIRDIIKKTKRGGKQPFEAFRLNETNIKPGDLICYAREPEITYETDREYKGHCDIVTKVNRKQGYAEVIGGNVSHGVTKRIVNIDKKGYLTDTTQDWFVVIKNNK